MQLHHALLCALSAAPLYAQQASDPRAASEPAAVSLSEASLSPAEQKIAEAHERIAAGPKRPQGYNALALALARRARETADPAFYAQAMEALRHSREVAPDNFEAQKLEVWVLLGQHEFATALERATALNARFPDDIQLHGFLVDANVELGNYAAAERAAQWMLDMRPGNIPGLTRGAYLRELFGDTEGAIEFFDEAFRAVRESEVEDRAWMLTQIAHLRLSQGKADRAEKNLAQALELFPDYHYALAQLAKVRLAQGDAAAAAEVFQKRYQLAPHPENLYDLACALEVAGQVEEARELFRQFEERALAESKGWDNANKELVFYYADHAPAADGTAAPVTKALEIAALEVARRRDVLTLDAYAWALHGNGRHAEAQQAIEAALQVGIQDARMLYHAGAIAADANDVQTASRRLHASLDADPTGEMAGKARELLTRIDGVPTAASK